MLENNGQLRNFNAKGAKIFLRLLKIFLRFARALRSAKFKSLGKVSIEDESCNRDSSGNPFLWLGNIQSNVKSSSTKKIVADSPTRAVGFGKARELPKFIFFSQIWLIELIFQ